MVFKSFLLGFLFGSLFATNGLLAMDKKRKKEESSSSSDQKRRKQEEYQGSVPMYYGSCLQQFEPELKGAHGLHCGYYALWHLQCLVKPGFFKKIKDRAALNTQLSEWERLILDGRNNPIQKGFVESLLGYFKPSFSSYTSAAVNNLTDGEIERIIEKYELKGKDQVTVIHAQNQLKELSRGVGLTDEVINRIENFRRTGLHHFFIINTANDSDSSRSGGGHFILVVLYWKDGQYMFDVYDSARPDDCTSKAYIRNRGKYQGFCNNIYNLFVEKNLDELRIHHARTVFADRVLYYLSPDLQNRQSWVYVRQCEEYFIELLSMVIMDDSSLNQDKFFEKDAKAYLEEQREVWGMNKDLSIREGVVPVGYTEAVCDLIGMVFDRLDSTPLKTKIKDSLHEKFYSYQCEVFYEFAIRVIIQAFKHACKQDTPEFRALFIENFYSHGIARNLIEAALQRI